HHCCEVPGCIMMKVCLRGHHAQSPLWVVGVVPFSAVALLEAPWTVGYYACVHWFRFRQSFSQMKQPCQQSEENNNFNLQLGVERGKSPSSSAQVAKVGHRLSTSSRWL
ncbi:hypothetical protein L9F63_013509, partial [Diploptera punctata]